MPSRHDYSKRSLSFYSCDVCHRTYNQKKNAEKCEKRHLASGPGAARLSRFASWNPVSKKWE